MIGLQIFGYIEESGRILERPFLTGSWNDKVVAHMPDGSQWTLFEINPLPSGPNRWDSAGQHAADSYCTFALLGS